MTQRAYFSSRDEPTSWEPGEHFDVPHLMRTQAERENVVAAYYAGRASLFGAIPHDHSEATESNSSGRCYRCQLEHEREAP